MKFPADTIERIKELGYKDFEARFLYIVAVHSGYFTLRQFREFAHTSPGRQSSAFTQKLLKKGHASIRDYMNRGSIFHLFSEVIYGQVEEFATTNRRKHSFDFMRVRLLLLDFILANQELDYFETERAKIKYFCSELHISQNCFPARKYGGLGHVKGVAGCFSDKFPLFLFTPFPGAPPLVTFSYVDSGSERLLRFSRHLARYQPLFRELKSFRFLYIAGKDVYFQKAADRFHKAVAPPLESEGSNEVLRYFQIREKWERHDYVVPVAEDFEFLNRARRLFAGERFEELYRLWAARQISDSALCLECPQSRPHDDRAVFFDTFLVNQHSLPLEESFRGS